MELWLPQATRVPRASLGVLPAGGNHVAVFHTTEGTNADSYDPVAIAKTAQYPVHIWWNPNTGVFAQNFPANEKGRGLEQHNGDGSFVVQVEVCGHADKPFTDGPMKNAGILVAWLDQLGIPRVAPGGNPPASPGGYGYGSPARKYWGASGYYGHSQVPDNAHSDPGSINWEKLWGGAVTVPGPIETMVICPHPDDEIAAWGMFTGRTLFLYITQGERTAAGAGMPAETVRAKRKFSTLMNLQAMMYQDPLESNKSDTFWGDKWVAQFCSLPDGAVTEQAAKEVISAAVAFWRPTNIISAAYVGDDYTHKDHVAVNNVLPVGTLKRSGHIAQSIDPATFESLRASANKCYGWMGGYINDMMNGNSWGPHHVWERV